MGWKSAHEIDTNGDDPMLLAISSMKLNGDDGFLSKLKGAYSSCNYFSTENELRRKRRNIVKSSDGLFRYHHCVLIPRPAEALKKALLLEYHDNAINEASQYSPFEVMCGYQSSTSADRLLSLTCDAIDATDSMTLVSYIRDVI